MKNLFILLLLNLASCSSPVQNQLTGKWMMDKVIQNGKDVSTQHNPHKERFFLINEDGTFISDGRPYGKNTGKYIFDKNAKTLAIDSDAGPDDDSNWKIIIEENTMIWQGYGTEWTEDFQIHYIRN